MQTILRDKYGRFTSPKHKAPTKNDWKKLLSQSTQLTNHVAFVIDESGSMSAHRFEVVKQFNKQLAIIKSESQKTAQDTTLSLYTFSHSHVREVYKNQPVYACDSWLEENYYPNGGTPLYDAVGRAIARLSSLSNKNDPNTSFLVLVITDGEENQSVSETLMSLQLKISIAQATDRWTFAFICPPQNVATIESLGIPRGNIQPWSGSTQEYERIGTQTLGSTQAYYTARSAGKTSTKNFFTVDLDHIKATDLKALVRMPYEFSRYKVEKEIAIKAFVESHGRHFLKGDTFYQLTKKEEVQDYKQILIEDRKTKVIYGGSNVRSLLSLPTYGTIKVEPGNFANYNIYVQSTSDNRKLVRGTQVLVRK